jgi:alcohol dehydrogenase
MKAAQINAYKDQLKVNPHFPTPSLQPGKVLVEVHSAGLNPVEGKIRDGHLKDIFPLQFPATLGTEFSGVITEVGEGVVDFKKGDEVYGQTDIRGGQFGSFTEILLMSPQFIAPKPKKLTHVEAASLPVVGVSALQALMDTLGLKQGQKILIHGGAGGIGTIAIQLAKHMGAYVATTVSEKDMHYVKDLGADEVIDYKNQTFEDILHDYDAVLDNAGGETYLKSFKVLKKGGILVSKLPQEERKDLMDKYGVKAVMDFTRMSQEQLYRLAELVNKGVIKVHIDQVFPLDQAEQALAHLQTGHPRGKVVLDMKK